jgi:multiple sugar transport system substrate-binding protein
MNRMTRRAFLRVSGMAGVGAVLAACAPAAPGPAGPSEGEGAAAQETVTISYMSWGTEEKWASEQRCFQPFYDAHPEIEVEFIGLAWTPYWQKVLTGLASGDPPDIFRMEFWKSHAYYARGVILPITDYFEADGINPEELFIKIQEQSVYDGEWYGMPRGATGNHVIYYNRNMFDEVGIEWPENTPDWTWDDFLEIAGELTRDTDGDGEVDVWGFDSSKMTQDWNGGQSCGWGWGGSFFNADGTQSTFNTPEVVEGVQFLADLRNKHQVAPYPAQLPEGMGDPFLIGKVAMNETGGFMINVYKIIEDFDWGIATIPAGPQRQVAYSKPNATVITRDTKSPDASWALLKHIFDEETVKCEAVEGLWPPCVDSVLNSDWYLERETPPYNMAPTVPSLLLDGQAPRLDPRADQIRRATQAELDPVWLGEKTIAEVAPIIDEKVNEILTSEELPELS